MLKITFIKELKMEFFVVFTKFYFFLKTFLHLLLSLTLHWPGNHPSHQSDKNSQNKTSHGSSSRPPEKAFFTGSCKAKQCSIDAWHQKPRITFLGWFSPPPSTDASQLPPCAERFSTAKCSSVLERGAHCCGAHWGSTLPAFCRCHRRRQPSDRLHCKPTSGGHKLGAPGSNELE